MTFPISPSNLHYSPPQAEAIIETTAIYDLEVADKEHEQISTRLLDTVETWRRTGTFSKTADMQQVVNDFFHQFNALQPLRDTMEPKYCKSESD